MAKFKKTSKLSRMRQTLAVLGKNAKPREIQPYLKKKFGLDMNRNYISSYKNLLNKPKKTKSARSDDNPPGRKS